MPDALYRSYSLEKSLDNGEVVSKGTLTTWENNPVSALDVGDSFRPVPNGPLLTVKKVNISDNVIGTKDGKPFRQWQISIEGDNEAESGSTSATQVLYNFNFDADEKSGSMEVTNTGENPSVTLSIGDTFNVPGVGNIPCVNVKGSDTYDENGRHIWTVVYEGSNVQEAAESLPENKYSFSIEKNDGDTIRSGSVAIASEGSSPTLSYEVGSTLNIPGLGNVKCTKISASDEHSDSGAHIWTVTYEGSDAQDSSGSSSETLPQVKYSFAIDKDGSSSVKSGTMQVVNLGNAPTFSINVGDTFAFPGLGNLTCVKVSGNDEYTDSGTRIWTVTYEGTIEQADHAKYSFAIDKDGSNSIRSGSMQVVNTGSSPSLSLSVGQNFNIPGLGNVVCTGITASDDYTDSGQRLWTVTYEHSAEQTQHAKYSLSIDKDGDASISSGSMQVTNTGSAPSFSVNVGQTFNVPGLGNITCKSISASDDYTDSGTRVWTVTYEGNNETAQQVKYSLSIAKDRSSSVKSGSMQVINEGKAPSLDISVGNTFNVPGVGDLTCINISANDEYTDGGVHVWTVTYEGAITQSEHTKYSFSKGQDGNSGSMQATNEGESPSLTLNVGDTFNIPGLGSVKCTNISVSDEYTDGGIHVWTVTYEHSPSTSSSGSSSGSGSGSGSSSSASIPEDELSITYEINGSTVRSVSGELLVLRKSQNAVTKKTITEYNNSEAAITKPGETYSNGTVISENIVKETVKDNNTVVLTYYRHTIEVEI